METENEKIIYLNGNDLTLDDVINIAEKNYNVDYKKELKGKIRKFRQGLERQLVEHPEVKIYGTNVGCGDLKDMDITPASFEDYQVRYIKAHNCGTGKPLPIPYVRAMMVIRLNSFAKGLSAMRMETCQLMIDMINKHVTPWVLEEGSVGASGDLVPLAMVGAVLIGLLEAKAYYNGELLNAPDALKRADLSPTKLGAKEAMGLTNGSNFIAAIATFSMRDADLLLKHASLSSALALEAIRGEKDAFSELINSSRPHKGQTTIAKQIRNLVHDSKRMSVDSQLTEFPNQLRESVKVRVQDRYSYRAIPPVHGATFEAIEKLKEVLLIEVNSATDNPLFFIDEDGRFQAISGANFHGQPIASVIDYLKITLTSLGLITDKRTFTLLDKYLNYGLPADLAIDHSKGDTGLMIAQYAGAARAAENRILATASSIMSISTAANQEDFVSMGSIGVIHLRKILYNLTILIAIELLCAHRALQMTNKYLPEHLQKLGDGTQKIYDFLNKELAPMIEDKYLKSDIDKMVEIVNSGILLNITNEIL